MQFVPERGHLQSESNPQRLELEEFVVNISLHGVGLNPVEFGVDRIDGNPSFSLSLV